MNTWLKKDLQYIWHPYTQMKDCRKFPPLLIEKARGVKLFAGRGKWYYDTISSWWCNVHGHSHPRINQAIKKQLGSLEQVLFAGFTHRPAIWLAERLITLAPGKLSKVFFSDNGSTAVEVALKLSFQYWHNIGKRRKHKFISLDYGYHGDTIGAMSVSGVDCFNKVFSPLFFPADKVPAPYCYRCPMGKKRDSCGIDCLQPLEKLLQQRHEEISGFILEPMLLGAGGMIVYPREYLVKAANLAKKFSVHLILDEVATGFGRTGKMFAAEYVQDIQPDFLCLSKGITAGYLPFGATLTTDKVYQAFYADYAREKTFYHGHTYSANPLSCAAALASLEIFRDEQVLEKVKNSADIFQRRLANFTGLELVGDTRGIGLIGALELVKDKTSKKSFSPRERLGFRVYQQGLQKGLVLRPLGNIIYLFLPLCVRLSELEDILERTYTVVRKIKRA
jgi:adenosylmethionine-8-amino-7-oxononanoate aminotransferase